MSTDETNPVAEAQASNPSTEVNSATDVATASNNQQPQETAAPAPAADEPRDEDERRTSSEDFGQLLDQFEQEQSALQEGEVVTDRDGRQAYGPAFVAGEAVRRGLRGLSAD